MGIDAHAVVKWIERGYLRIRLVPIKSHIWQIRRGDLVRFIAEPDNWAYYRPERIRDPMLRSFAPRVQARHPELADYLTPTEAAAAAGCSVGHLNKAILQGRVPAKRWDNWRIFRRDAEAYGRRLGRVMERWPTPASDAFLMRAKEECGAGPGLR